MDDEIGHGLKWSAVSVVAVRLLQAARSLVIARVIGPKSVGSFAAAFAFVALASLIAEFGLQSFLVQRGRQARADARAVGEITIVTGVLASLVLLLAARPIALFYGDGQIAGVVVALVASVFLTALMVVPNALLRADFRFDAVARIAVTAEFAACVVGIGLAVRNAGVWSLVAAALAGQFVTLLGLLIARPDWVRSASDARAETRRNAVRFGLSLASGSAVWTFALQGDNVMVGRVLGATALGLYAFAYNYGIMPGALVSSAVTDVALAGFSGEASDERRATLFSSLVQIGATAASPLVFVALALAPAGLRFVLGSAWVGATKPLQILLVVGWVRGVLPTEALLRSKGRVKVELQVGLVAAPMTMVAAYAAAHTSLTAVGLAVGGVLIGSSVVATRVALDAIQAPMSGIVSASYRSVLVSAVCVSPLVANEMLRVTPDAVSVFVGGPLALFLCFVAIWRLLPGEWEALTGVIRARR